MLILTIKTDQPESEFALYNDQELKGKISYLADRNLAATIHQQIQKLLKDYDYDWADIKGLTVFTGPGSFTGLRIGLTVANTLAYGLKIPIVGDKGSDWQSKALTKLLKGQNDGLVRPFYGAEPHITKQKK